MATLANTTKPLNLLTRASRSSLLLDAGQHVVGLCVPGGRQVQLRWTKCVFLFSGQNEMCLPTTIS